MRRRGLDAGGSGAGGRRCRGCPGPASVRPETVRQCPPLLADWKPHVGIGSPFAIATAVVAVAIFPRLIRRLRWRSLLITGWAASVTWTVSLALVDGWQRGWVHRLTDRNEYLHDLPRIHDAGSFLADFTSHIRDLGPGSWTTHVSSHPPAATLVFYLLDRIGLRGGGWAGALVC
jgi:hypothetical protein